MKIGEKDLLELSPLSKEELQPILEWNRDTSPRFLCQWSGWSFQYPLTLEQLLKRLELSDSCVLKITLSGSLIGTVELMRISREEHSATVGHFLLDPSCTGRGYGTCALEQVKALAAGMGLETLYLNVFSNNRPAVRCYEKAGFALTERLTLPDGQTGLRMRCLLRPKSEEELRRYAADRKRSERNG